MKTIVNTLLLILASFSIAEARVGSAGDRDLAVNYQPNVVTVEAAPARRVFGSLSFPEGSAWCNGKPTYWLVGHESVGEAPYCLVSDLNNFTDFDYTGSVWEQSSLAVLNGPKDRHDCAALDMNNDGIKDIACGIGAFRGTGDGFNEVYLTNPSDGSVSEVLDPHGLQKYTTMRNRLMVTLKRDADGSTLVLLATRGNPRDDGLPNEHRMFRLIHPTVNTFDFEEVDGPWIQHTKAKCLQVVDVNQDGLDDIFMCNEKAQGWLYVQNDDGSFESFPMGGSVQAYYWNNVRVADMDGDGTNDLIIVGYGGQNNGPDNYVRIYKGTGVAPYFDFSTQNQFHFGKALPFAAHDVEVLDVNGDGLPDLYVTQVDEDTSGQYCSRSGFNKVDWWGTTNLPPDDYVPPADQAHDLLLIGNIRGGFRPITMEHSEPGCGFFLEKFGNDRTVILGQGDHNRPGHNMILQW